MAASKQNFFQAHWDVLLLVVGVLAVAAAGGLYVMTMGEIEDTDTYRSSLESKKPSHEGVEAADLTIFNKSLQGTKTPIQLSSVDPKKASVLASERRVLCRKGDPESKKKACGRPIPSDTELCPFCGVKQVVVKVEVDTDHDGMPNDWEKKYGFNPNDPADAAKDADGDGFTNLEEYKAETDPKDKTSHPDYLESLALAGGIKQTTLPFYFNAVTPIPGGHRFTFQRVGMKGFDAKVSVKMNEEIAKGAGKAAWQSGWTVVAYEKKEELQQRAGTKMKVRVDVSTVDVQRKSDGKKLTIRMNERTIAVESQITLHYNRGEGRDITVSEGTEFTLGDRKYRVTKLRSTNGACEVTVLDLQTKKEKIVR